MKKRKKIKKTILMIVIILVIVICFFVGKKVYYLINTNDVKVVDKINNYNYTLEDRDTEIYKNDYNALKNVLNDNEINFENYAKYEANLFIIDLYTISNKINKYDIGGIDFIYPESLNNYKLKVQETLYKYMEDNTDKKRKQELPEVSEIKFTEVKESKFKVNDQEYDAYKVEINWNYVSDMDYDKKGTITMIKKDNILYVVEFSNN